MATDARDVARSEAKSQVAGMADGDTFDAKKGEAKSTIIDVSFSLALV